MTTDEANYICREASEADLSAIAEFLERHDFGPKGLGWSREDYVNWLKWKFLSNPAGPGRMFVAEGSPKTIVGFRVSMPCRFSSAKTGEFIAYQGVDMLVDANLRGKGVASTLLRLTKDIVKAPRLSFPVKQLFTHGLRRGDLDIGPRLKWWFPVSVAQTLSERHLGFISPFADLVVRLYVLCWLGPHPTDLRIRQVTRFSRGFEIDSAIIHGVRSAEFLNWRFIDNRMHSYHAYEFCEGEESVGYCVYAVVRSSAEIYDFVADRRHRACLRLLVDHCREQGIAELRFRGIGLEMGKFGFVPRPDSISHCKASPDLPEGPWMLTHGDRDY